MQTSSTTKHDVATGEKWLAELPLSDGVVRFRPVRPEDQPLVAEAIRTASRETLLHRFFSPIRDVPPDLLHKLLTIDPSTGACIVGVLPDGGKERIICGARYVRVNRPNAAEIAITVHDDFQRRGLGKYLLNLIMRIARADGIRSFEADVMTTNSGMLKLLRTLSPPPTLWHRKGDVYHVVIDGSD